MENFMVFDTETISVNKPFCYNIGYVIGNEKGELLAKRSFVIEQIWHNKPLFETAYYANKKPIYISALRSKKAIMRKYGNVMKAITADIAKYGITKAFAYNSKFDVKVFEYNCSWYGCKNPLLNLEINDIRGYAHQFIVDNNYKQWCEDTESFTEAGNYSTTAEAVYRYISNDNSFEEAHTALNDSIIEYDILLNALSKGASINGNYQAYTSIVRQSVKPFDLYLNGSVVYHCDYNSIYVAKDKSYIKLKN